MYTNIGKSLKSAGTAVCIAGIFLSLLGGIGFFVIGGALPLEGVSTTFYLLGIAVLGGGILISVAISMLLYGFGELIEKTTLIEKRMQQTGIGQSESQKKVPDRRTVDSANEATPELDAAPSLSNREMIKLKKSILEKSFSQGQISKEDYEKKLAELDKA